jgi:hypothetical protein
MTSTETMHIDITKVSPSDKINEMLANGATVTVWTDMGRGTRYTSKHSGVFFMQGAELHVRRGRKSIYLGTPGKIMYGKITVEE